MLSTMTNNVPIYASRLIPTPTWQFIIFPYLRLLFFEESLSTVIKIITSNVHIAHSRHTLISHPHTINSRHTLTLHTHAIHSHYTLTPYTHTTHSYYTFILHLYSITLHHTLIPKIRNTIYTPKLTLYIYFLPSYPYSLYTLH